MRNDPRVKNQTSANQKSFGKISTENIQEMEVSQVESFKEDPLHPYRIVNHQIMEETSKYSLQSLYNIPIESEPMNIQFSQQNEYLSLGFYNGLLEILNSHDGSIKFSTKISNNGHSVTSMKWKKIKNQNIITAVSADGQILSFDINDQNQKYKAQIEQNQLLSLDYNYHQDQLYIGTKSGMILIYDEEIQKVSQEYLEGNAFNHGHSSRVFSIKTINDNSQQFISGGWDGMLFLWDLREQKPIKNFMGQKIGGNSIDYKKGKILFSSYETNSKAQILDIRNFKVMDSFDPSMSYQQKNFQCYHASFDKSESDFDIFLSSNAPHQIWLFEQQQEQFKNTYSLEDFRWGVFCFDISQDNFFLALGTINKTISLVSLKEE